MRRWQRPIHDFLMPYLRGAVSRVTGENITPSEVRHRRDLDTLADMLNYLRDLRQAARDPEHRGRSAYFWLTDHVPSWPQHIYVRARGRAARAARAGAAARYFPLLVPAHSTF